MLLFLLSLLGAVPAHACGNPVTARVVGWAPDGSALVRRQHADHAGELHALELYLVGPTRRHWDILTLADHGDPEVRGRRWEEAERRLTAMGVTIDPEIAPVKNVVQPDGLSLHIERLRIDDEQGAVGFWLVADTDEGIERVQSVYRGADIANFHTWTMWHDPRTGSVVILDGSEDPVHLSRADVAEALDFPRFTCVARQESRLVGWGPGGRPLFRLEEHDFPRSGSSLCRLELHLVGADQTRAFKVVSPFDVDPEAARKAAWPDVERQLAREGVVLDPTARPALSVEGQRAALAIERFAVPGRAYTLDFVGHPTRPEGELVLRVGGRKLPTRVPVAVAGATGPIRWQSLWVSPRAASVVLVPRTGSPVMIPVAALDTAFATR